MSKGLVMNWQLLELLSLFESFLKILLESDKKPDIILLKDKLILIEEKINHIDKILEDLK